MKNTTKRFNLGLLLAGVVAATMAQSASAASTWVGNTGDFVWSSADNWGGILPVPSTTTDLSFGYSPSAALTVNNLTTPGNNAFRNIAFNSSFLLLGSPLQINGNVSIANNAAGILGTSYLNMDNNGTTTTYTTTTDSNNAFGGRSNLAIYGVLSGAGGLTKAQALGDGNATGNSKMTLTGANTYSGITTLTGGILSIPTIANGNAASPLGQSSNAATNLVFNAAATNNPTILQYTGANASTDRNFTITVGTTAGFDITANNLTLTGSAAASTGLLAKYGVGTLTLAGAANGYTSATNLYAGTTKLDFSAPGAAASQLISASSDLNFSPKSARGAITVGSQTLMIQGANGLSTTVQNFNNLNIGTGTGPEIASGHLNLVDGTGGNNISVTFAKLNTYAGDSQKGCALDIAMSTTSGDKVLFTTAPTVQSGLLTNGGSYTGITINGTDWATYDATRGVIPTTYTTLTDNLNSGSSNVDVTASGLRVQAANSLRFNTNLASNAILTLNINNASMGTNGILESPIVGGSPVLITGGGIGKGNNRMFLISQNNTAADMTIASVIQFNAINTGLIKTGAGRVILTGANTYFAQTEIAEGQLQISSNANLGLAGANNSAPAPFNTNISLNGTLEVRGGGTVNLDGIGTMPAGAAFTRSIILGSGTPTIDVDSGTTCLIAGGFNTGGFNYVSGPLTKNNAGTLTLTGANFNTGGIVLNAGTLNANASTVPTVVSTVNPQGMVTTAANLGTTTTVTAASSGSATLTLTTATGVVIGEYITGTGIPALATVTGITGNVVTLSAATTAASAGNYIISGSSTATSTIPVVGAATKGYAVGQLVNSALLPAGTTISAVNANSIVLSASITAATGTNTVFSIYTNVPSTATFNSGVTSFIVVNAATVAALQVGQAVTGTGIALGTVVTAVNTTTGQVTLNQATTAGSTVNPEYVFGGLNQFLVSSTTSLRPGGSFGAGFTNYSPLTGVYGNIISDLQVNNNGGGGGFILTNVAVNELDSLGQGAITINGGTLDLGGLTHLSNMDVTNIKGGTIQNGSLLSSAYVAAVPVSTTATVSATAHLTGATTLTKSGTGTLVLSGTNPYTGGTLLRGGQLNIDNAGAINNGRLVIADDGSGTAVLGNSSGAAITLAPNIFISLNSGFAFNGPNDLNLGTGQVTVGTPLTITVNSNNLTMGGQFTGGNGIFDITKAGVGTLTLSNANGVTMTASQTFNVNAGTEIVGANLGGALFAITKAGAGTLVLTNPNSGYTGTTILNAGTLTVSGTGRFGYYAPLLVNGGTLDLAGTTQVQVGAVTINSGTIQNGTLAGQSFTATNAGQATVSANLSGASLSSVAFLPALTMNGTGRLTLAGNNTFTQDLVVNSGTLQIYSNANLGAPSGTHPGNLWLNGTLQVSGGTAVALDGVGTQSGIFARSINLGTGASTISVDAATALTVSGGFNYDYYGPGYGLPAGGNFGTRDTSGTLTKNGTGTLVLSGANQSPGGLILDAGTLVATTASTIKQTKNLAIQGLSVGIDTSFSAGDTSIIIAGAVAKGLTTGQLITGYGFADGTTITGVSGDTVSLSSPSTLGYNINQKYYNVYANAPTSAIFTSGSTSISVGSAANIQVGQVVTGPGIAMGTVVTVISGTAVTLNQTTTLDNVSGTPAFAFGGINQYITNTTGLAAGLYSLANGLNGTISGIQGNVVSDSNINNGNFTVTGQGYDGYDSLGNGSVTVNGGTLDLNNIAHQLGGHYWSPASGGNPALALQPFYISGGTVTNGTLAAASFTATNAGPASISANLVNGHTAADVVTPASLTMNGTGTLSLSGTNTYSGGTAINAGTVALSGPASYPGVALTIAGAVTGGAIAPTATLDLGSANASMQVLIANASYSTDEVRQLLASGSVYAGGTAATWAGAGIISTAAKNGTLKQSLGYLPADVFNALNPSLAVATGNTIVKYTYAGDTSLKGYIDATDFAQLDASYLKGTFTSRGATWYNGDFNYDGKIDSNDFAIIAAAYTLQGGPLAAALVAGDVARFGPCFLDQYQAALSGTGAVPEPASLALLGLGALGLRGRRRSR